MDAAPRNRGLEDLTPPPTVASLIGFVHELTDRTRLFEGETVPRTELIPPFSGQILSEKIATKYQIAVSTQVQWDMLRERYLVRADHAKDFTRWLVKWQQWRINAMYGVEEPEPRAYGARHPMEFQFVIEGPVSPELQTYLKSREPFAETEVTQPRGYRKFKDPVEQEKLAEAQEAGSPPAARADSTTSDDTKNVYDERVRESLGKGNKAVWSGNVVAGSAAAGYKSGAEDAAFRAPSFSGPTKAGGDPTGMSPMQGRYRPPMTVVLQPGQSHLSQQNDLVIAIPGAQGVVAQAAQTPVRGIGGMMLGQLASRLPLGRIAGIAAGVAGPVLGAAMSPIQRATEGTVSPMASFVPAAPAPAAAALSAMPPIPSGTPAPPPGPAFGMMTLFAPPMRVSSPQASAAGSAVEIPVQELTSRAGPLDQAGIAQLRQALPPGASLIYPALPNNELPPGASNVQLAPSLLGDVLGRAYGPAAAQFAPELASRGVGAKGPAPSQPIRGALVPEGRPAGAGSGVLPGGEGSRELDLAGGGMASRGNALDFLGLPVRMAPSLGGRSELRDEIAAKEGVQSQSQPKSAQPEKFAALRQRMFNSQPSMNVEPDEAQWERARPSFGLTGASPAQILSPTSRVQPLTMTSPLPQMGGIGASPMSLATPTSGAATFQPQLARSSGGDSSISSPEPTSGFSTPESGGSVSSHRSFALGSTAPTPETRPSSSPVAIRFPKMAPGAGQDPVAEVHPLLAPVKKRPFDSRPQVDILPVMPTSAGGPLAVPSTPPEFPSPSFARVQSTPGSDSQDSGGFGPSKSAIGIGSRTGSTAPKKRSSLSEEATPKVSFMPSPMSTASLTPGMPVPRRTMSSPQFSPSPIQLSRSGESPSASGSSGKGSPSASTKTAQGGTGGGAAQEVDMLAKEVYSLIRRRLAVEAERRGR